MPKYFYFQIEPGIGEGIIDLERVTFVGKGKLGSEVVVCLVCDAEPITFPPGNVYGEKIWELFKAACVDLANDTSN